jgi:hypothetical protein
MELIGRSLELERVENERVKQQAMYISRIMAIHNHLQEFRRIRSKGEEFLT